MVSLLKHNGEFTQTESCRVSTQKSQNISFCEVPDNSSPSEDLLDTGMKMSSSSSSEPGDNLQSLVGNEHLSEDCVISSDSLDGLKDLKIKNFRNPFLGYLNINHLRNKIVDPRCILKEIGLECISISETKLDSSFPDSQFKIDGYHFPPFRKDRNCHGGGLMVFVKSDIIVTRFTEYELEGIECICTKITIAKKHWLIFSVYRPSQSGNIINFLTASIKLYIEQVQSTETL